MKKKKTIITILLILELIFISLSIKSFSNKDINNIEDTSSINKKTFAMYKEDDNGEYIEVSDNKFPSDYRLNYELTTCKDNKENTVDINEIMTFNNGKVTVKSKKTVFCTLYFDIVKSIYNS